MATSHFFRNYSGTVTNQQNLYEDLIAESIRIQGHDVYYMPRESWDEMDQLFGENVQSRFERAYLVDVYIVNVNGWEGQGEFFSKFGLEIRQGTNMIISRRTFDKYIPTSVAIRPREGDLIYVPVMSQVFEIKFVEEELLFFSLGKKYPYIYEMRCEAFRYSNEDMNTGVQVIDEIENEGTYTIQLTLSGSGNYNIGETVYQGASLTGASTSAEVSDWDPQSRVLSLINIKGQFTQSSNVIGSVSNTSSVLTTADTLGDHVFYDLFDNKLIQNEANTFVDLSEVNVFGKP